MICRNILILLALTSFALAATSWVEADTYEGTLTFAPQDLTFGKSAGFDVIHLKSRDNITTPGAPNLPLVQVNVALPADALVSGVEILHIDALELPETYDIMPNAEPVRLSDPPPVAPFQKDPAVFGTSAYFPLTQAEVVGTWDLVGQDFVTLEFYPVQYNPIFGKLLLATRIDFAVQYEQPEFPFRETYNFSDKVKAHYEDMLREMAFNPDDVAPIPRYIAPLIASLPPGSYEYVIITTTSFETAFQPLADWRTQRGIPANIVTTSWIYTNYSGGTNKEKIRNFMIDANTTWGSIYFLLGGDTAYVPYDTTNISGDNIPNDTYYSDFDDDWKCELYVGRAAVTSTSAISTFVNKITTYEKNPPAGYGDRVFFMGFNLDSSTPTENTKKGIKTDWVPAHVNFSSEYDSEGGGHESDVKSYMNLGQNLVNHCDHGETDYLGVGSHYHNSWLSKTEAKSFTNANKYCNFYTIACLVGNYPNSCWGEALVQDNNGGITFVGNSRYGWYQPGSTGAYSLKYDQKWWETLYSFNKYRVGVTHAKHKNKYYPSYSTLKYIFTELNLLGDPALHLWTDDPANLTVTHDASINTGSQTFLVNVKDGGANVQDALVCVMKGSEVYAYELTDAAGNAYLAINPATAGTMTVTASAQNYRCYEGSVSVQAGSYPPVIDSITPLCGVEGGFTPLTILGSNFTTIPATEAAIGGSSCLFITVVDSSTITCMSPPGTNGWADVEVSNTNGSDTLVDGYRYFPTGGDPFNGTDLKTDSIDAPATITLIMSGQPMNPYILYLSFGGGPVPTPFGIMGLDFPILQMVSSSLNSQGYAMLPLALTPGYGPLDIYFHTLSLNSLGDAVWAWGGNNPNGSGSILFHLNN